jgi:O-antigen/teichoic acid export membrane protein
VTTAVNVLAYVAYGLTARRLFPALRITWRSFSQSRWRDVTAFSVYLFVIDVAVEVVFNVDNLVIGAVMGTSAVAIYAVALRLSQYQRRLCDQFSGMLFPVAVSFKAQGNLRAIQTTMIEGARMGSLLIVGATICLVGFAEPLVRSWMGSGFEASVPALIALAFAGIAVVAVEPLDNILIATGSHRFAAAVWVGEAIANLGLSLMLVRPYGLAGVAVGTTLPLLAGHFGVMLPVACRRVSLPLREAIPDMFGPALIGAFPAVAVCVAVRQLAPPLNHLTTVVLYALPVMATYVLTVIVVGLRPVTRATYLAHARRLFGMNTAEV